MLPLRRALHRAEMETCTFQHPTQHLQPFLLRVKAFQEIAHQLITLIFPAQFESMDLNLHAIYSNGSKKKNQCHINPNLEAVQVSNKHVCHRQSRGNIYISNITLFDGVFLFVSIKQTDSQHISQLADKPHRQESLMLYLALP